ncbi:unnamed protein product [Heterobilharzia americana]|nr:unnamed protein product [Heterobilharzia americana]
MGVNSTLKITGELKFICSTGDYKTVTSTFCIRRRCYNVATNSSDLTLISYHNHRLWAWNAESWNGYSPLSIPRLIFLQENSYGSTLESRIQSVVKGTDLQNRLRDFIDK